MAVADEVRQSLTQGIRRGVRHLRALEMRIKRNDAKGTAFADLMWKPRCLIEMKRAGVDLSRHYRQALDYRASGA